VTRYTPLGLRHVVVAPATFSDSTRQHDVDSVNILSPKMLLVPPPHGLTLPNGVYLTANMSFFLASFLASQDCMQGLQFTKEPSSNTMFLMIAWLANMLLHIVALNWCKNVASETGLGKCIKSYSTSLKITYPYITKSILHDTVIFIIVSHAIQKKIASL